MNGFFWGALIAFVVGLLLASPCVATEDGRPWTQAFILMLWGLLCLGVSVVLAVIGVFV